MDTSRNRPVLVVVQLSGGNDALNTVVPYGDSAYFDNRPGVGISESDVLPIDGYLGFHPALMPIKELYDDQNVAIVQGIGYPNPNRSHFRSMDIWHTCEPDKIGTEGWLGRTIRELDPHTENVLTGVNFGRGLPRALSAANVSVASVGNLESYGLLSGIAGEDQRQEALEVFSNIYSPAIGRSLLEEYISQTGTDVLKGADTLRTALDVYSSDVEYADNSVAQYMKNIAQVHLAGLGTRVFYTSTPYNSFDTHAGQETAHTRLLHEVSSAVYDFYRDLNAHDASAEVLVLLFSEFGRRVRDNGTGTDHGSGGIAFIIGDAVNGGLYGEYPSLQPNDLLQGDLQYNNDFRGTYASLLDQWMGLESKPIVGGHFEQFDFIR
jgi:uncharacterized protein (DUF1501 family)